MPVRRAVFMRNLSAVKALSFLLAFVVLHAGPLFSDLTDAGTVAEKYEESSRPLFQPAPEDKKEIRKDPFYDRLRRDRRDFLEKQRESKRKFYEKIRQKDWSLEEQQKKLAEYHKNEVERNQKFMKKQRNKIDKHSQRKERGSLWTELYSRAKDMTGSSKS